MAAAFGEGDGKVREEESGVSGGTGVPLGAAPKCFLKSLLK